MKRESYLEMTYRQQKEFNEFPIVYAFNEEQIAEGLKELGATDISECVTVFGHGDIVKKTDAKALIDLLDRHASEKLEAMKNEEFAEAAFLYEMNNHEYAINWDGDAEVLAAVGLSADQIEKFDLEGAYRRARMKHMTNARESGVI